MHVPFKKGLSVVCVCFFFLLYVEKLIDFSKSMVDVLLQKCLFSCAGGLCLLEEFVLVCTLLNVSLSELTGQ